MIVLIARAFAGELGATAAFEALPDSNADTDGRARVGVHADAGAQDWQVIVDGAVQSDVAHLGETLLNVERLQVSRSGGPVRVVVGRLVKDDARGRIRLDGLSFETQNEGMWEGGAWAGRMWFPDAPVDDPSTWLVGATARWSPFTMDDGTRTVVKFGAEGRIEDETPGGRLWVAAGAIGLRGARADALIEAGTAEDINHVFRADLGGTLALGRRVDGGLRARWEGLAPAGASTGSKALEAAIAPEGYGNATVQLRGGRELRFTVEGGPTAAPDDRFGGQVRLGASREVGGVVVGVDGRGVLLGAAGFGGAGVSATRSFGKVDAMVDAAGYRLRGLDGLTGWVTEGRIAADAHLGAVDLRAEGAGGSDRLRQLWVRAGVSVSVHAPLGKKGGA